MGQPHYVSETTILRRIARDPECRFIWTKHAIQSVIDDSRTTLDVELALTNSRVILHETKKDLLWRAVGTDVDGNRVQVVVAVDEQETTIKVVTTF
jgi:hypothetical protein